jgi:transcriptional regulator with PAS, ATPase and Fis domain
LAIGISFAILPFLLFQNLEVLEAFELRVLSFLAAQRGARSPHDDIVLITVDDATVAELGSPLPRRYYATLIHELNKYGPKAIAFDLLFTEAGEPAADDSLAALSQKFGNVIHSFHLDMWGEEDSEETNGFLLDSLYLKYAIKPQNEKIIKLLHADEALFPSRRFADAFEKAGMVTLMVDADDRFQKLPLVFKYAGKTFPSLSLAALCEYLEVPSDSIRFDKSFWGYQMTINTPEGTHNIPIDRRGRLHLNFYGPFEAFETFSILQVLEALQDIRDGIAPRVSLRSLEGKIVIVGSVETANKDSYVTPFSADFAGMGIFATAAGNMLNGDALRHLPWYADAGMVLLLALFLYAGLAFAGKIVKAPEEVYTWLIFGAIILSFNLAAYFVLFKSMHIAPAILKINSSLFLVFFALSYHEKTSTVKTLKLKVLQLESEINEKLSNIDLISTKISSQDEMYRAMEAFIRGIERILNNPSVEKPHPLEASMQKLIDNQKIIKEQVESQLNRLRADKDKLQYEKEKLEIEKSVYVSMTRGEKAPEPPRPIEPPLEKYKEAVRVLQNYKAFVRKEKTSYCQPEQAFGMVTAVIDEERNGESNKSGLPEVFAQIARYAAHDYTVLITGENGTGKELVARAIHQQSSRRDGPFVDLNCAAIPETLIESELFGYVKGAFTGSNTDRPGAFEQADGGTIFLDEIGDLAPDAQVKLLRVLQEKTLRRLGSNKSTKVDVRVIAATNHDLQRLIQAGKFREDLYFRLNVADIHLPALRERKDDIPHLVHYFLAEFNETNDSQKCMTDEALMAMTLNDWPGNVRELQNIVVRVCVQTLDDLIHLSDLPEEIQHLYREIFKKMPIPLWEEVETEAQAEMNTILLACRELLRAGNVEPVLRSGQLQRSERPCKNCYDYVKTFIDSKASLFPQEKRERLAKQIIVAMYDQLSAWCKDQKLGPMEQMCKEIEKLLGRTRRQIDNWKHEVGFPERRPECRSEVEIAIS